MRTAKDYLLLILKGIGMGAADVVPGVSGGTIAFITNIYEELINSLKSVDADAFKLLTKFQFKDFWKHINGNFLLAVLSGVFISILSLAKLLHYLLDAHPIQIWSFFFGLVLISALWILNKIQKWNVLIAFMTILGCVIAYYITSATPATTPDNLFFVFISGAVAICAMILPGISGSFLLLIMGKYQFILGALKDLDITVILVFLGGCVVGLLSFVRLVAWFLNNHHDKTISILAGFMIGSLYKIWPWKETLSFRTNSSGEKVPFIQNNILPTEYLQKTGNEPDILSAIVFFAIGILIVVFLEKLAKYLQESKKYA